jgi:hypothetical protein
MNKSRLRRPSHATVVAYLALFTALGGSAYAASKITSADIANNTIKSKDVHNHALLKKDFKAGQLPAGERGPQGPRGLQGLRGLKGATGAAGTAKAFAFVNSVGALDTTRSKGVNSVLRADLTPTGGPPGPEDNLYCFDLTFDPKIAVASAFANNAGIISAADIGQGATEQGSCTAPHNDAMVRTWGSDGGSTPVGFSVIFE